MGTFKESEYYMSKEHIENMKRGSILGNLKIQELKDERIGEYNKNPNLCKECQKPISYEKKNENKFCDSSCAAKFNNKNRDKSFITDEFKSKISKKIIEYNKGKEKDITYDFNINCSVCNKPLTPHQIKNKRNRKKFNIKSYCSNSCRSKDIKQETKDKIRQSKLESVRNGTHKGWTTRNIISYPEKFFMDVLKNNKLEYKHNFVVSKKDLGLNDNSSYFLDFYFEDRKIDLEIDGKQHRYRKEHDELRDGLLENFGIKVYRIEWKNPINEKNKEYMENEINKFMNYMAPSSNG